MPIQFRCTNCRQKLAISRRKAGQVVKCPACAADQQVPTLEEATATGALVEPPAAPPGQTAPSPEPTSPEPTPEEQFFDEVPPEVFDDLDDFDEPGGAPPLTFELPFAEPPPAPTAAPAALEPPPPIEQESARPPVAATQPAANVPAHSWDEDEEETGFHLARRPIDESGLDMTPMVDVTFLLLIFFMITASFSIQKSMETEAPEPDEEGAAQMPTMDDLASDSVIVEIDENDVIFVDDTQVASIADVVDQLELKIANEQKREMIIQPHPLSRHGTVVQVTDAGIEVGMQRIRRVTQKSE
jgi:biopolymer transport protein ExbD/phage FluMu protein Com